MDDKERAFLAKTIDMQSCNCYLNAKDSGIYPLLEEMAKSHHVSDLYFIKAAQMAIIMERLENALYSENGSVPDTLNIDDIARSLYEWEYTGYARELAEHVFYYIRPMIDEAFRYGYYQAIRDYNSQEVRGHL